MRYTMIGILAILLITSLCLHGIAVEQLKHKYEMRITSLFRTYPIDSRTPWSSLSIQNKMVLCAYGSSGNKLNKNDMKEIEDIYAAPYQR